MARLTTGAASIEAISVALCGFADMSAIGADETPSAEKGAYVLLLRLRRRTRFELGRLGAVELSRGNYAYAGSAYGPGGLRARIRRHLKLAKTPNWHIDLGREAATVLKVWTLPGGNECAALRKLIGLAGAEMPIDRFGASDCRSCRSHFVALR